MIDPHFVTSLGILPVNSRPDTALQSRLLAWPPPLKLGHGAEEVRCRISALSPSVGTGRLMCVRAEVPGGVVAESFGNPGSEAPYPGALP